ncbi:hypothetical protein HanXRQr2_Chr17g0808141 [Helianthus annuus]|uniref:Uncharacterized protein n=1 Tax=Helianthus annuus TaxID=4232 RepID=A0A9K3GUP8_HELAN|nr:hypothetical protein HanXRQr2_Chr17g0808141 [Helianthus annuus]KAJ0813621.1 hypothetical protein HanPSC8_Chr17g0775651 [Helianthus annuus]
MAAIDLTSLVALYSCTVTNPARRRIPVTNPARRRGSATAPPRAAVADPITFDAAFSLSYTESLFTRQDICSLCIQTRSNSLV